MARSTSSTSSTRRATSTFSYEVSRSLASCEGALLVVDASQGVEAQTLANAYLAINHGLEVIPVINKIDLPSADIVRTQEMIEQTVGLDATDAIPVSRQNRPGRPRHSRSHRATDFPRPKATLKLRCRLSSSIRGSIPTAA